LDKKTSLKKRLQKKTGIDRATISQIGKWETDFIKLLSETCKNIR
jgi:DNA-binding Xre family transcriptional regulator